MDGTAKSRRREQLRNPHKAVTMFSDRATCLSIPSGKATAPECQPPVCCFLPAWFRWLGSWVNPTRLLPNGYISERYRRGKRGVVIFWASSIN